MRWCGVAERVFVSGIASLLMFPEDESGESSQQEEEESEGGETDEQDPEDYALNDEQLERRRFVSYTLFYDINLHFFMFFIVF